MLRFFVFLAINFSALAIGSYLMGGSPVENTFYQTIEKAPWTPPGWVFGAAWSLIMLCFTFYLTLLTSNQTFKELRAFYWVFGVQFILNVGWNPTFFYFYQVFLGLIILLLLIIVIAWFCYIGFHKSKMQGVLMLPYFLWLLVAFSLNGYIFLMN